MLVYQLIGAVGLTLICLGIVFYRRRKRQAYLFIAGGVLLEIYSIYLQDWLFIVLQGFFILSAVYALTMHHKRKKHV